MTDDGSHTLFNDKLGENYHSSFGAIQESKHIFIDAGLNEFKKTNLKEIRVLEVGVGTGLNVLLTYLWASNNNKTIYYVGYEPFPINSEEVTMLNYTKNLQINKNIYYHIHRQTGKKISLSNSFSLLVNKSKIEDSKLESNFYDVVFFDAFSATSQPELWTTAIFTNIFNAIKHGGILTTYSCKGTVKRALVSAGFMIEKLPGPPGKREFLRAWKS